METKTTQENQNAAGLAAATGYAPWVPPFTYHNDGQWIQDSRGERLMDMRGWGYLTGRGAGGLALGDDVAAKLQDQIGTRVAALLNADAEALKLRQYLFSGAQ